MLMDMGQHVVQDYDQPLSLHKSWYLTWRIEHTPSHPSPLQGSSHQLLHQPNSVTTLHINIGTNTDYCYYLFRIQFYLLDIVLQLSPE